MFISFEGLDFCGKTTQIELLKDYLTKEGRKVEVIREPGGTVISEKIREILLDKNNSNMFMETEVLLFAASRAQLVREVIIPKLKKGYFVISDRFHDSSIAYQAFGRGLNTTFVKNLQNFAIGSAVPDITFFIDIPLDEVERRKALVKKESLDRIELSEREFYEKVREGYLELAKENERIFLIDGQNSIEKIQEEIRSIVNSVGENEVRKK